MQEMAHDLARLEAVGLRLPEARHFRSPRRARGPLVAANSHKVRHQSQILGATGRAGDAKRKKVVSPMGLVKAVKVPWEYQSPNDDYNIVLQVLQDLAKKCPNLTHMLLDFAQASQLHDFTDLSAFPTKLKFLTLNLSDVIFLDNFMKRIYSFINGLEMLNIVGTYEKAELEEGEIYEVVNIKTLKQVNKKGFPKNYVNVIYTR